MPAENQDKMKGTSPSPAIQRGNDQAWGQQNQDTTTAQAALAKKHTNNPVSVPGNSK